MHIDLTGLIHAPATATLGDGTTTEVVIVGATFVRADAPPLGDLLASVLAGDAAPPVDPEEARYLKAALAFDEVKAILPGVWCKPLADVFSDDNMDAKDGIAKVREWLNNSVGHVPEHAHGHIASALWVDELSAARKRSTPDTEEPSPTDRMLRALPQLMEAAHRDHIPCAMCLVRFGDRAGTIIAVPLDKLAVQLASAGATLVR